MTPGGPRALFGDPMSVMAKHHIGLYQKHQHVKTILKYIFSAVHLTLQLLEHFFNLRNVIVIVLFLIALISALISVLSCLMNGFTPHILPFPSLTDCLNCGPEHEAS